MDRDPIVSVVEDDRSAREATCYLLGSVDLQTNAHASAEEFLDTYDPAQPGCLVVDVRLRGGMSGLELQHRLAIEGARIPVILVTAYADVPTVASSLKAGAADFLCKPFSDQVFLDSCYRGIELDRKAREEERLRKGLSRRLAHLTQRQRKVMELMLAGRTTKAIAEELCVSERTVENERHQIRRTIDADSPSNLTIQVLRAASMKGESKAWGANNHNSRTCRVAELPCPWEIWGRSGADGHGVADDQSHAGADFEEMRTGPVSVVEDDRSSRESMCFLLRSVGLRVEEYASAEQFLDARSPAQSGCLVVDVRLRGGMSGLELQDRLTSLGVTIPIIFVTAYADVPIAVRTLKEGAFDFLEKPFSDQIFLDSCYRAIEFDRKAREEERLRCTLNQRLAGLTERQHRVMELIAAARTTKAIAKELSVSERTVENERHQIRRAMTVGSLSNLLAWIHPAAGSNGHGCPFTTLPCPWDVWARSGARVEGTAREASPSLPGRRGLISSVM